MIDVVVIGAGPSGNTCAALTAQAGLSTLVLEEHDDAGLHVNCTGIIGVEAFKRLNLPTEPILSSLQGIRFLSPAGKTFRYHPGEPLAHIVSRRHFDRTLREWAEARGAEFRFGYHARLIQVDADAVEIRRQEEDPEPIRARAVVIATGFGTNLPAQAGLEGPRQITYGAQAVVEMDGLDDVEIHLGREVAPDAFAWVVPLDGQRARVGLVAHKNPAHHFWKLLSNPNILPRIRTREPKMLLSPIPMQPIRESVTDRVVVVGEAAGQVKTTTQGGIYYGMLCAGLAAEALVEGARQGDFRARTLQRYEKSWRRAIEPELKAGLSLRDLFSGLSDQQIDALVELGSRDDILSLVRRLAQFDWHRELIQTSLRLPELKQLAKGGLW